MASKAQMAATNRYNDKAYDRLAIRIKKGLRDKYKQAAAARGLSLAGLVQAAVDEYIGKNPEKE